MNYFRPSKQANAQLLDSSFAETEIARDLGSNERSIGEIIKQANNLSPDQIESILKYQRVNGVRFGEAAVALDMASSDDVLLALAQQFHYPYPQDATQGFHSDLVVANKPFTDQAEAFRTMRSHLIMKLYSQADQPRQALAVLSSDSGDGKSYFAANIAVAFSQLSGRTLLIDADMRNPRQHEIFGLPQHAVGLSSILSGRASSQVIHHVQHLPSLYVLPVGVIPPNPIELVERPAFGMLVRELLTKFDRIIVDTPAASKGADGAVIAAKCGAAVLMARRDHSRLTALQNIVHTVSLGRTQVVGAILNEF